MPNLKTFQAQGLPVMNCCLMLDRSLTLPPERKQIHKLSGRSPPEAVLVEDTNKSWMWPLILCPGSMGDAIELPWSVQVYELMVTTPGCLYYVSI